MIKSELFYASFILIGTFLSAISQVLLKKSANKTYKNKVYEYLNPFVIIAYSIFVLTTFLSIFAYRGIPLSMGPILEATGYLYITFFGIVIFNEKMTGKKFIALLLIISGISVYSLFG